MLDHEPLVEHWAGFLGVVDRLFDPWLVNRVVGDARRFCEGRDTKPGEICMVRYHPEDKPDA